MIRISVVWVFIMAIAVATNAQQVYKPRTKQVDIAATFGNQEQSIAGAFNYNWGLGKSHRWDIGVGIRTTSYFGVKKDFITAPAKLARSNTVPFLIVLAAQEEQNFDTLTVQRPLTFATNLSFNAGYHFSPRWYGGVNIDVIGFTIGRTTSAVLTSNGATVIERKSKPSQFNLLLTGDNDLGSLNSEFFLTYRINKHFGLRAIYQFYFSEYKTTNPDIFQTAPDGTTVTRFRNKVNAFGLGINYQF